MIFKTKSYDYSKYINKNVFGCNSYYFNIGVNGQCEVLTFLSMNDILYIDFVKNGFVDDINLFRILNTINNIILEFRFTYKIKEIVFNIPPLTNWVKYDLKKQKQKYNFFLRYINMNNIDKYEIILEPENIIIKLK